MKKRTVALLMALMVVFGAAVGGTIAWLTSEKTVTNTFTAGDVEITLDETKVDENGDPIPNEDRVEENKYHLVPGSDYTKDPVIHVEAGSEECYLFVEVINNLDGNVLFDGKTLAEAMTAADWTLLEGEDNVWYQVVNAEEATADVDVKTFTTISVPDTATDLNLNEGKTIVVNAYAVQKENVDTVTEAWAIFDKAAEG